MLTTRPAAAAGSATEPSPRIVPSTPRLSSWSTSGSASAMVRSLYGTCDRAPVADMGSCAAGLPIGDLDDRVDGVAQLGHRLPGALLAVVDRGDRLAPARKRHLRHHDCSH